MDGIDLRPIRAGELDEFFVCLSRALGFPMPPADDLDWERSHYAYDRTLAAFDADQIVGTAHSHRFELTMPGGAAIPAAGVTAVSVSATHRRRGILRRMMQRQLTEARDRGEPAAILLASESVIYGRFGYGMATMILDFEIDTRRAAFRQAPSLPGRTRFVDEPTAAKVLPEVFDRARRSQPGAIDRNATWWERWARGRKPGQEHVVVYESPGGQVDGYALYRTQMTWDAGLASHTVRLNEMFTTSTEASAALWHHCLNIDLAAKVVATGRPADEPLRWWLADLRQIRTTRYTDFLWLRILDVEAVLSARTYRTTERLALQVDDAMFEDMAGVYELHASPDQPRCVRSGAQPDLRLSIADLGACALGEVTFRELTRAGRVVELTAGAVERADAAFQTGTRPWCNTGF